MQRSSRWGSLSIKFHGLNTWHCVVICMAFVGTSACLTASDNILKSCFEHLHGHCVRIKS
jgi:hypothetical protein